jgi:di/tricarboxylate transporter
MLVPIVVGLAEKLGVDSRPFIITITVAASCAFALPMGYQTHMMVYGPGGYKFSDYIRMGVPLNLIIWLVTCSLVPLIWHF